MKPRVIAIGASAGGILALRKIFRTFTKPSDFAVMVVLHLPPQGPNLLPELLQQDCDFTIKEADSGEKIESEHVYIAPPDYHLCAEPDFTISLNNDDYVCYSRPSIDFLMTSVAHAYKKDALGIHLTGANQDGADGMHEIHLHGGYTIVQSPDDAEFPVMPQSSLNRFKPDKVLSLKEICSELTNLQGNKHAT